MVHLEAADLAVLFHCRVAVLEEGGHLPLVWHQAEVANHPPADRAVTEVEEEGEEVGEEVLEAHQ